MRGLSKPTLLVVLALVLGGGLACQAPVAEPESEPDRTASKLIQSEVDRPPVWGEDAWRN